MNKASVKKWWKDRERGAWMTTLAVGMLVIGMLLSAIYYERIMTAQRARMDRELSTIARSYATALSAKDELISRLARRSQHSAEVANDAAAKANQAANKANKAAGEKNNPEVEKWTH